MRTPFKSRYRRSTRSPVVSLFCGWCLALAFFAAYTPTAQASGPSSWRLKLSWSPEYCRQNSEARKIECDDEHYFVNHGLIAEQHTAPAPCSNDLNEADASRWLWAIPNMEQLLSIWRDEGSCSGLNHADYFAQVDRAGRRIVVPESFEQVSHLLSKPSFEIRSDFTRTNPGMPEDSIALLCNGKYLREVQICMNADMGFVACGDTGQCPASVKLRPIRLDRQDYKVHGEHF